MNAMMTPKPSLEALRVIDAEDLLRGQSTVQLVLGEQVYTLRLTRSGKLILTK